MECLSDIVGVGFSAASGGIFGAIAGLGSSVMKYFNQKQEFKQEQAKWEHQKSLIVLKTKGEVTKASWEALIASHQQDSGPSPSNRWGIVDAIKTLYRPFLTTMLFVMVYLLFQDILNGLSGKDATMANIFDGAELKEIMQYMVHSMVFTTASAGMWWFSERAFAPPGMKNR